MVNTRPDWSLVKIYADEGISGTSLKHRDQFIQMISDCKDKKLDLIVTKSVSRFARNVVDCIGYIRVLSAMNPPVGVYFETENIFTLNSNAEMSLSFISTLAQEESHNKSEIMNSSIEMRFKRGIFLTPVLLGFDHDVDGQLIVNNKEAKIVKLCFYLYYLGYSSQYIADLLLSLKCKTKKGNIKWSPGTVLSILQNERYCGDILARKTWTPNYLDHKSKKNRQDRNQYRQKNHHEAIIPRDIFIAVQHIISNRKYGTQSHLPNLKFIKDGYFKGFVSINPRWASFNVKNYQDASINAYDNLAVIESKPLESITSLTSLLKNFQITRAGFFSTQNRPYIFFDYNNLRFSLAAIHGLKDNPYVEIFIHPGKYQLMVRVVNNDNKNCIKWISNNKTKIISRRINGSAFIPKIYDICGWNYNYKYRVLGFTKQIGNSIFLIFDLHDTEIFISKNIEEIDSNVHLYYGKYIKSYPENWKQDFGISVENDELSKELFDENELILCDYYSNPIIETSYSNDELYEIIEKCKSELSEENN